MPLTGRTWREKIKYMWRDGVDRWRALPKRRQWAIAGGLLGLAAVALPLALWSFFSRGKAAHGAEAEGQVVLYTSVDTYLVEPIIKEFEDTFHIKVDIVGDTEATKTTGLVARLIAEKAHPRADVWWSSEPMGTVSLASQRLLEPFVSKSEYDFGSKGWPEHLRAQDKTWYGFAQRTRVIGFNTNRLTKGNVPTKLRDLTQEQWRDKIGMARPQFGTTRTQIAALVASCGEPATREWLQQLQGLGVKIYEGNSAVAEGLGRGEVEIGLTDSDDVWAAQRNSWPVDLVYPVADKAGARFTGLKEIGPVVIPNTIAKIKGCPHPNEAARLADFLLSARVEELLAQSDSRNVPIRPDLAKKYEKRLSAPTPAAVDPRDIAAALPAADRLINELFPLK